MSPVSPSEADLDLLRAMPSSASTPNADARADARARLLEATARATPRSAQLVRSPSAAARRRVVRRRVAGVVGIATTLVVVSAIGLTGGSGSNDAVSDGPGLVRSLVAVPQASASDALQAAAAAAIGQPTVPFGPGTRWVVRTQDAELYLNNGPKHINGQLVPVPHPFAAVILSSGTTATTYAGRITGTGRQTGPLRFTTRTAAENYRAAGSPTVYGASGKPEPIITAGSGTGHPFSAGSKQLSSAEVLTLPTNPRALERWVKRAATVIDNLGHRYGGRDSDQLQVITQMMTTMPLTPQVRGALWNVAATLPNLRFLGPTKDPIGREGIGITALDGDERREVVFSPATGMLLSAWIYKQSAVTTCDGDLEYCSAARERAGDGGKPWTVLAVPGSVEQGTTVLSAAVEPQ